MDVKERIQAIIDSRPDLTVRNVALKAGMSDSILNKFLGNPDQSMTLRNIQKVADAMDIPLRYLLFGDDPLPRIDAELYELVAKVPADRHDEVKGILEIMARRKAS